MSGAAFGVRHDCEHCGVPLLIGSVSTLVAAGEPLLSLGLMVRREYGPDAVVGLCAWCLCVVVLSHVEGAHAH